MTTHPTRPIAKRTPRPHYNAQVGIKTRQHILDVAERLFAEHGPEAVSIRSIAKAAHVNLGAVNHHFGTKERLLEAVFTRRIVPLNERRMALLDRCEAEAGPGGVPRLEDVIEAMVRPSIDLYMEAAPSARAILILQFLTRAFTIPPADHFTEVHYGPMRKRFITLLQRALPHLTAADILWRYNFLVGAVVYAMAGPVASKAGRVAIHSGRPVWSSRDEALRHIVTYAAAGFRAPSVGSENSSNVSPVGSQPPRRSMASGDRATSKKPTSASEL